MPVSIKHRSCIRKFESAREIQTRSSHIRLHSLLQKKPAHLHSGTGIEHHTLKRAVLSCHYTHGNRDGLCSLASKQSASEDVRHGLDRSSRDFISAYRRFMNVMCVQKSRCYLAFG